jgi:elongation factor Ts
MKITAQDIKKLREETGAGVMDCKQALTQAKGVYAKAKEYVIERGLAKAEKKANREVKEGAIAQYVHATGKTGALVELLCETDYVARNNEFLALSHDLAMQVVAMNPATLEELMKQDFIKDPGVTVEKTVMQLSGKIGEKLALTRFVRYQLGE